MKCRSCFGFPISIPSRPPTHVPPGLHATRSAVLQAGRDPVGAVGEVDPGVLRRFDVDERVAIVELNLAS